MPLTTAGRNFIATAIMNSGPPTFFDASNSYLGSGNSSTAFAIGQTDLQGASKSRKAMESTYPQISTNVLTFRSLWGTSEGNYAWEEWGVFNHASAGTMLCRKVEALGTKTSAQSWQLTATVTINIGS